MSRHGGCSPPAGCTHGETESTCDSMPADPVATGKQLTLRAESEEERTDGRHQHAQRRDSPREDVKEDVFTDSESVGCCRYERKARRKATLATGRGDDVGVWCDHRCVVAAQSSRNILSHK